MGLLPIAVLVVASVGIAASALLRASRRWWRPAFEVMEPGRRVRWLQLLLATPGLLGSAVLALALGPCLHTLVLGIPDGCESHGGPAFSLCLFLPVHVTSLAWLVGAAALARPFGRALRVGRAVLAARRLLAELRPLARRAGDGVTWVVPGSVSFTTGWPRAAAFVGRELVARLSGDELAAVLAHEAAHLRRGDIHRKLAARLLASTHVLGLGESLVADLDLAIEQSCDAEAARAVGDPLIVAQALIDASRLPFVAPVGCIAAFAEGKLDTRIAALCAPAWRPSRRPAMVLWAVLVILTALAIGFDHPVHDAVEASVEILAA